MTTTIQSSLVYSVTAIGIATGSRTVIQLFTTREAAERKRDLLAEDSTRDGFISYAVEPFGLYE